MEGKFSKRRNKDERFVKLVKAFSILDQELRYRR